MTRFRPNGASLGDPASSGIDEYALWDAAYVLGSLCSADRRAFEARLGACGSCRQCVSELSAMPGLLARLTYDAVAEIDEGRSGTPPQLSPQVLMSLLAATGLTERPWTGIDEQVGL
jgi:hypothetical protein